MKKNFFINVISEGYLPDETMSAVRGGAMNAVCTCHGAGTKYVCQCFGPELYCICDAGATLESGGKGTVDGVTGGQ